MKCLSLKKYLDETSLHGFGYANDKNKFFVVFWAILTTVCVYYTIHDILALVDTFQSIPLAVAVSVKPNLNAILPTPTLCMEIMASPPENKFTVADINGDMTFMSETNNFTMKDINADIKAFMSATHNGENLNINSTEMQLTDRLEYLTYLMLGYISDFELIITGDGKPMYTDYVNKYNQSISDTYITGGFVSVGKLVGNVGGDASVQNFSVPFATSFQSFIQSVYRTYMTYKVSLGNLKLLVGMSICHKQIGSARYGGLLGNSQGLPITSICQADTITHLSFSLLCIKMFNTSTYTVTDGLTVSLSGLISASKSPLPAIVRTRKCQENLTLNTDGVYHHDNFVLVKFLWYVDLQGRYVLPTLIPKDILVLDPAMPGSKFDISVATEYNHYGIPTRPCSSDVRQQDCIRQKKAELISQSCNCWPSTLLGVVNTNKMPTCSDNPANLNSNVSNVTYLKCEKVSDENVTGLCNPDCNANFYTIGVVDLAQTVDILHQVSEAVQVDGGVATGVQGSVEIGFQSASLRSLIVESPAMPFTTFACSFGGIIGTYLGGSILAFVHIPIFIVAQLTSLLTKRKKVENSEKTDEKINNLAKEEIYPPVVNEAKVV